MTRRARAKVFVHAGEEPKAPLHYTACGLDDVWLVNGYEIEEYDGESGVSVRNMDKLHDAISASLVKRKKMLTGKEVRFLRLQLDLTQSELARLLGCNGQQVARYEKGENRIAGPADRILRMLVREHLEGKVAVKDLLRALDEMDSRLNDRQVFTAAADGNWLPQAA